MERLDDPEVLALTSPEFADVRVDFGIARAEVAAETISRHTAELWASITEVLDDAARHPEIFIDERAQLSARERRDYAVRSAVADLAARLTVAEGTVRAWGEAASTLRRDASRTWQAFLDGRITPANARVVADTVAELPQPARGAFDRAAEGPASRLTPARFRAVARSLRDRLHAESLAERHRREAARRRIVVQDEPDGMTWLSVLLPSEIAHRAIAGIDARARRLRRDPAEFRTLEQLQADVAGDLLTGSTTGHAVGVTVAVTVPVLTLLGSSDEPGVLEGVGPIDADNARRLAAEAPSFTRILTHPITGAVLALDRTTYRVPSDLAKTVRQRDRTCRGPGCGRLAADCDIDHIVEWQDGGGTDVGNLMHLCRHHHRLKSVARWRASPPDPEAATITWTSPTGHVVETEPPPF
jgi:hypothetical protein